MYLIYTAYRNSTQCSHHINTKCHQEYVDTVTYIYVMSPLPSWGAFDFNGLQLCDVDAKIQIVLRVSKSLRDNSNWIDNWQASLAGSQVRTADTQEAQCCKGTACCAPATWNCRAPVLAHAGLETMGISADWGAQGCNSWLQLHEGLVVVYSLTVDMSNTKTY